MAAAAVDPGIPGIAGAVEVGRGGFSVVCRATQPVFDRHVAVKVIDVLSRRRRRAFQRECRAIDKRSGTPTSSPSTTPASPRRARPRRRTA